MLRFIFTLNVALGAAKRATFSRRKIAETWYERYIRYYVRLSLMRPNSFFMLTGEDHASKWFPSGPKLLASTGVIKWAISPNTFGPVEKTPARHSFKHHNQTNLLANYHPEDGDEGQSELKQLVRFEELTRAKTIEEIEITEEDAATFDANTDIMVALEEYIESEEQVDKNA